MDSFNALPQGWDEDGFYVDLDDVPRKVYDTYETDIIVKRLKETGTQLIDKMCDLCKIINPQHELCNSCDEKSHFEQALLEK